MVEKNERAIKVVAENRKARFNYAIEDTVEAGIALTGTESSRSATARHDRGILCRYQGRRDLADQRQHSGIPAGQPLQPRAETAAQAVAAPKADQQADGRGRS